MLTNKKLRHQFHVAVSKNTLKQRFPTFFADRTPNSGQNILRTPKNSGEILQIYIAELYWLFFIGQLNVKPVFTQIAKIIQRTKLSVNWFVTFQRDICCFFIDKICSNDDSILLVATGKSSSSCRRLLYLFFII